MEDCHFYGPDKITGYNKYTIHTHTHIHLYTHTHMHDACTILKNIDIRYSIFKVFKLSDI